jgi:hypothetical protein
MRPNTLHCVYSVKDSICRGGHYYATSTMRDTFMGLVHTLFLDMDHTRTSQPPSRFLLAEMINFYHSALVQRVINSRG